MSTSGCMSVVHAGDTRDVPRCSVCCDVLGSEGGPCTLPCGAFLLGETPSVPSGVL